MPVKMLLVMTIRIRANTTISPILPIPHYSTKEALNETFLSVTHFLRHSLAPPRPDASMNNMTFVSAGRISGPLRHSEAGRAEFQDAIDSH
jgi:hypothetical protein